MAPNVFIYSGLYRAFPVYFLLCHEDNDMDCYGYLEDDIYVGGGVYRS